MVNQMFQRPKCDAQFFKDPRSIPYGIRMLVPEQIEDNNARFWFIPKTLPLNQFPKHGSGWIRYACEKLISRTAGTIAGLVRRPLR